MPPEIDGHVARADTDAALAAGVEVARHMHRGGEVDRLGYLAQENLSLVRGEDEVVGRVLTHGVASDDVVLPLDVEPNDAVGHRVVLDHRTPEARAKGARCRSDLNADVIDQIAGDDAVLAERDAVAADRREDLAIDHCAAALD